MEMSGQPILWAIDKNMDVYLQFKVDREPSSILV
jgi:hypothetical protein